MAFANPRFFSFPFLSSRGARLRLAAFVFAGTLLLGGSIARAAATYENPFGDLQPYVGRTDMGVDFCLSPGDPLTVAGVSFPGS